MVPPGEQERQTRPKKGNSWSFHSPFGGQKALFGNNCGMEEGDRDVVGWAPKLKE